MAFEMTDEERKAKAKAWFDSLPASAGKDRFFTAWMAKVDAILTKKLGVDSNDLPDFLYDNEYADGATPAEAAKAAIKAAKEF